MGAHDVLDVDYFQAFTNWLIDLIWPARCLKCRCLGTSLCENCAQALERPAWQPSQAYWAATSLADPTVSTVVWHFKYRGMTSLAAPIARLMAARFATSGNRDWFSDNPLLVPIPLHQARLRERGYNQAELLARALARITAMRVQADALVRIKHTHSQVESSSRTARLNNMQGAFAARHPELVRGHSIILIDDVCTTGATLDDCARALVAAGAKKVTALTFARAVSS